MLKSKKQNKNKLVGYFQHGKVIVENGISLYNKGYFGEMKKNILELSYCEALYLMEKGKLEIKDRLPLSVIGFARKAKSVDPRFWIRYTVYSDIRSRGYIVKEALKYGADFLVYDKGDIPGKQHSKYLLFAVDSNDELNWRWFAGINRIAHGVKKEVLIGLVDEQGDVTYYLSKWMRP